MEDIELLRKKIERLKRSQEEAEMLLEAKSQELYNLNQDLERKIQEKTKSFEEAKNEAVAANQAKSQFLANMSHEIRTPLNGMLGFIGLLEKSELTTVQREQLSTVAKSGRLLLNIINDILEFSKIEAGKLEMENQPFHLKRCVEDIVDVMANEVYRKGLEFPIYLDETIPKQLIGDEARVRQVLVNLIGNASKFTHSGEIALDVNVAGISSDGTYNVRFSIKDTGVGISQENIVSIFSAFEQADISDTRKYGGTGLGLTISKKIIETLGGRIWVESEEGKGTQFFIELPLKAPDDKSVELSDRSLYGEEVLVCVSSQKVRENLMKRLSSWQVQSSSISSLSGIAWNSKDPKRRNLIVDYVYVALDSDIQSLKALVSEGVHVMVVAPPREKIELQERLKGVSLDLIVKPVKREKLFNSISSKIKIAEKESSPHSIPKQNSLSRQRILLVEDNIVNQKVAIAMLELHGHSVGVASNGQEAVDMFSPEKYDVVLMDCQMPVMDGFQATRHIKQKHPETLIIAMTANAFKKTKDECLAVGMDDFITKPVTDSDLVEVIKLNLMKKSKVKN